MNDLDQIIEQAHDKYWDDGFESLAPHERIAFAVHLVDFEVNNGGFEQYFENTSNWDLISTAQTALGVIRAAGKKQLFDLALQIAMDGKSVEEFIDPILGIHLPDDKVIQALDRIDGEYYKLDATEDVYRLLERYLQGLT